MVSARARALEAAPGREQLPRLCLPRPAASQLAPLALLSALGAEPGAGGPEQALKAGGCAPAEAKPWALGGDSDVSEVLCIA